MYLENEAFILKNAANKNLKKTIIQLANNYKKKENQHFIKCWMVCLTFIVS